MNYHHDYHAGGFSDVLKHVVLVHLLNILQRKDTSFCYLDTHAGRGCYDLGSESAKKTNESTLGIIKMMQKFEANIPTLIKTYLEIVKSQQYPMYYPGSPLIAQSLLRTNDRMILVEFQAAEIQYLRMLFKNDQRIAIHHQDGYLALKAFLPPKEGRGLILIDPAFEQQDDWDQLIKALKISKLKFPNGIYAIWYPLKDPRAVNHFLHKVAALHFPTVLNIELSVYPKEGTLSLRGSGMLIVNPPWKMAEEMNTVMPWLWKNLSINGAGGYQVRSLNE